MTSSPEDPEQRIADLEKQVADARRIADLERQLAEARSRQPPQMGTGRLSDVFAALQRFQPGTGWTPPAPVDTHLADAPRRIPVSFVLAELLQFRWWYVFALFLVAVPPIIVWITTPGLLGPVAVAAIVVIYAYQLWTARKRLALLRWGRVAQVVNSEMTSRATYYSGTTWSNVYMPQAHGWTVTREMWSGRNTKTDVRYALDSYQGQLTVSGRPYIDGVILADQRRPERALCVSSFAYDLDRDESGNWTGRLRTRLKVGMAFWVIVVIGWLALGVGASTGAVGRLLAVDSSIRLQPGATTTVNDSGPQTVYCNDGHLTVAGGANPVTVNGHCAGLTVSGINAVVTIDSVDVITLNGIGNHVTYHSGTPRIVTGGIGNTATRA